MAPITQEFRILWRDHTQRYKEKFENPKFNKNGDLQWFELNYNDRIFKYSVQIIEGDKPDEGFPLYVGLHGGGGGPLWENDREWHNMMRGYYWTSVQRYVKNITKKGGIYIAARGISDVVPNATGEKERTDTYKLHWEPESYILLQRAIRGLFVPIPFEIKTLGLDTKYMTDGFSDRTFVDPNRVFLLGFSAGGDGAFRFAANLPDIFAAVNTGGGHPNDAHFYNITSLPLCTQCGEKDTELTEPDHVGEDVSGVKKRAQALVDVNSGIDTEKTMVLKMLQLVLPKQLQEGRINGKIVNLLDSTLDLWYNHECFIVRGGGHNGWSQTDTSSSQKYDIFTNLKAWRKQQNLKCNPPIDGSNATISRTIDAVEWVSEYTPKSSTVPVPRTRNPIPRFVIWDLTTRPDRPYRDIRPYWEHRQGDTDVRPVWSPKSFMYWLFLRKDDNASFRARVHAAYHPESNSVWVDEAREYVGILLNDDMLKLSEDVHVYVGKERLASIKVAKSKRIAEGTLDARGDPKFLFTAMMGFVKNGEAWSVESVDHLDWTAWTGDVKTNKRVTAY